MLLKRKQQQHAGDAVCTKQHKTGIQEYKVVATVSAAERGASPPATLLRNKASHDGRLGGWTNAFVAYLIIKFQASVSRRQPSFAVV